MKKLVNKTLFIDTAPLIYYIEGNSNYNHQLKTLFEANEKGELYFQTSVLTLLEVLVQPLRLRKQSLADQYEEILTTSPNLEIFDVNIEISRKPAELRANYNTKTPDSIKIATGIVNNANFFFTNDKGLKRLNEIEVLSLDDL